MTNSFSYTTARSELGEFLATHSFPSNIAWVFAEDMAWVNGKLEVHISLPSENESAVRKIVEGEQAQRLGVELRIVGHTAEKTFCGVILPADEIEAEYLMIGGLKLALPYQLHEATEVVGLMNWIWARIRHREPSPFSEFARRSGTKYPTN